MANLEMFVGFVNADPALIGRGEPFGWKVIRWFQGSPLVHVFVAFRELDGEVWVFETSETLYHRVNFKERSDGTPLRMYAIDDANYVSAQSYCRAQIGTPYDYPAIAGLGLFFLLEKLMNVVVWPLQKILKMPRIKLTFANPYDVPQLLFCSQAVLECLAESLPAPALIRMQQAFPPGSGAIGPARVHEWIDKNYSEVQIS